MADRSRDIIINYGIQVAAGLTALSIAKVVQEEFRIEPINIRVSDRMTLSDQAIVGVRGIPSRVAVGNGEVISS
jgi:hypothetical protein